MSGPRGFTLIEALATIVALSIIAGALAPILHAASNTFAGATAHRRAHAQLSHAIDRMQRAIREIPTIEGESTPDIVSAGEDSLAWGDGGLISFDADARTLTLAEPGEPESLLADSVDALTLRYLDASGAVVDSGVADAIDGVRRIEIALTIDGVQSRAAATIRAGLGEQP
ncbi:MAG: type II secretion system protein [Phycisphaerales bacterium]